MPFGEGVEHPNRCQLYHCISISSFTFEPLRACSAAIIICSDLVALQFLFVDDGVVSVFILWCRPAISLHAQHFLQRWSLPAERYRQERPLHWYFPCLLCASVVEISPPVKATAPQYGQEPLQGLGLIAHGEVGGCTFQFS